VQKFAVLLNEIVEKNKKEKKTSSSEKDFIFYGKLGEEKRKKYQGGVYRSEHTEK